MQSYYKRNIDNEIRTRLQNNPVIALLGPRQSGKSTLAKHIISAQTNSVYLDLENPADIKKLDDPVLFFQANNKNLICLDEIQRKPDIFPVLRYIIDKRGANGQLLVLGSASRDLIQQSSETLAGRISYLELTPFLYNEVFQIEEYIDLNVYWLRGGFPRSILAPDETASQQWRIDFIRTFLERDIPQLGFSIPAQSIQRLWTMCAHNHGQLLNASKIGESLGVSHHTVKKYLDILEQTFLVRLLPPMERNIKKRMIKSPKIYIRDSGLLHALVAIDDFNDLLGHPLFGPSWEGMVIENIISLLPRYRPSFYRTSSGSEIDLVLERGNKRIAVECKASSAPDVSKGFWNAIDDIQPDITWVIAPVDESYYIKESVQVLPLKDILQKITRL